MRSFIPSVLASAMIFFAWATAVDIKAQLSRINDTYVSLHFRNNQDHTLSLLKWNNFLDADSSVLSFTAFSTTDKKAQIAGPAMVRKLFDANATIHDDHISKVAAGSSWTGTFDMTRLFNIPSEGDYDITLKTKTKSLTDSKLLKDAGDIDFSSNTLTTHLDQSPKQPKRLSKRTLPCDAPQQDVIRQSVAIANKMATAAYAAVNNRPDLYTKYFNDHSQSIVRQAYAGIALFNIDSLNITFNCNETPTDPTGSMCGPGLLGYAPLASNPTASVTLCDVWFTSTWSNALCFPPGAPNQPLWSGRPFDQSSTVLHELSHNFVVTGTTGIEDGPGQSTYQYPDILALAVGAAGGGGANDLPLTCAASFEYFAMEASTAIFVPQACQICTIKPENNLCGGTPGSKACVNACP